MTEEECETCGRTYLLQRGRDEGHVFMGSPECNHLQSHCPHCDGEPNLTFMTDDVLDATVREAHLQVVVEAFASGAMRTLAANTWAHAMRLATAGQLSPPAASPADLAWLDRELAAALDGTT